MNRNGKIKKLISIMNTVYGNIDDAIIKVLGFDDEFLNDVYNYHFGEVQ